MKHGVYPFQTADTPRAQQLLAMRQRSGNQTFTTCIHDKRRLLWSSRLHDLHVLAVNSVVPKATSGQKICCRFFKSDLLALQNLCCFASCRQARKQKDEDILNNKAKDGDYSTTGTMLDPYGKEPSKYPKGAAN